MGFCEEPLFRLRAGNGHEGGGGIDAYGCGPPAGTVSSGTGCTQQISTLQFHIVAVAPLCKCSVKVSCVHMKREICKGATPIESIPVILPSVSKASGRRV